MFRFKFQLCSTRESLLNLISKTLLSLQADRLNIKLEDLLDECLQYLIDTKIVGQIQEEFESNGEKLTRTIYETTKLGKATVEGDY